PRLHRLGGGRGGARGLAAPCRLVPGARPGEPGFWAPGRLLQRRRGLAGHQRPAARPLQARPLPGHELSQRADAGELIERVDGDVTHLSNFFSQFIAQVLAGLLLIVGILVLFWLEDWRVALPLTLYV